MKLVKKTSVVLAIILLALQLVCLAQNTGPVIISGVTTSTSSDKTVVSVLADSRLSRAQTWQDEEGLHVVIPDAATRDAKSGKGIKIRRVGQSVEILVQTKPGAKAVVQPGEQGLTLSIEGKLQPRPVDTDVSNNFSNDENSLFEESRPLSTGQAAPGNPRNWDSSESSGLTTPLTTERPYSNSQIAPLDFSSSGSGQSANEPGSATSSKGLVSSSGELGGNDAANVSTEASDSSIQVSQSDGSLFSSVFSGTTVLVVIAVGIFGLIISRNLRSRQTSQWETNPDELEEGPSTGEQLAVGGDNLSGALQQGSMSLARAGASVPGNMALSRPRKAVVRLPVSTPASLFGAYRVDQEVGKLITGQPHRMDVLSSRATDDRRAIENSLIKILASPDSDEGERRRAREALEEYGFVARQCAALLLAPDAFERTYAARCLGDIKSPAALPFLLEGLYDSESIVRNQAVVSIGELKIPAAIGALLDMARRHPDVPSTLVSRALSSCSVDGLDFFGATLSEPTMLISGPGNLLVQEITHLQPASSVEDLPEFSDDENFAQAISSLQSVEPEERAEAVKNLAQYQVQSSVRALSFIARRDLEANIRALAISSLAFINHESVFPAVLIGVADESREVRAAAARSLSRLSFERADAYARVVETADEGLLADVARASIQAGIVSQNIDRLASNDRRQAYEAFSLISLLAKARMTEPILDAICQHSNKEVRIAAIHLLAATLQPEVFEQLRELAVKDGIEEDVKSALIEALYKLDQAKPKEEAPSDMFWLRGESLSEMTEETPPSHESTFEHEFQTILGADYGSEAHSPVDEFKP